MQVQDLYLKDFYLFNDMHSTNQGQGMCATSPDVSLSPSQYDQWSGIMVAAVTG